LLFCRIWRAQKQKGPVKTGPFELRTTGAGEGIRTLDPNLGKGEIEPFNVFVRVDSNVLGSLLHRNSNKQDFEFP